MRIETLFSSSRMTMVSHDPPVLSSSADSSPTKKKYPSNKTSGALIELLGLQICSSQKERKKTVLLRNSQIWGLNLCSVFAPPFLLIAFRCLLWQSLEALCLNHCFYKMLPGVSSSSLCPPSVLSAALRFLCMLFTSGPLNALLLSPTRNYLGVLHDWVYV